MAKMSRKDYAHMYGPTTGDAIRLGDTSLLAEVEHDFAVPGEECLHGGGKTLRDGLGMTPGYDSAMGALDMLLCNALVIDPVLVYGTYLGGPGDEFGLGIIVDAQGRAYVTGYTFGGDFPLVDPIQSEYPDGPNLVFASRLSPDGRTLEYSTYLGGLTNEELAGAIEKIRRASEAQITGHERAEESGAEPPEDESPFAGFDP